MPVYMGENGVVRRANNIYVGVDGVTRSILQGFNAVGSARRQFFGRLDDISYVELTLRNVLTRHISALNSYGDTVGTSLAIANQYSSVSISGSTIRIICDTAGYEVRIEGTICVHFNDGRGFDIDTLKDRGIAWGAALSCAVNWAVHMEYAASSSDEASTTYTCWFCGEGPTVYVNTSAAGTIFASKFPDCWVTVASGIITGWGWTHTVEMTLPSYITIDGHSIPLVINNQLT